MRALYSPLLTLGLVWSVLAQQSAPLPSSADPIPDYVAFRLFFAAVAENSSPTLAEAARQDDRLKPIQLTDLDKGVLVKALGRYKAQFAQGKLAAPNMTLNAVTQNTLAELTGQMSQDGFLRLYQYVRLQKMYMKATPYAPSTTAHH